MHELCNETAGYIPKQETELITIRCVNWVYLPERHKDTATLSATTARTKTVDTSTPGSVVRVEHLFLVQSSRSRRLYGAGMPYQSAGIFAFNRCVGLFFLCTSRRLQYFILFCWYNLCANLFPYATLCEPSLMACLFRLITCTGSY